ncbi:MAG TPA: hypothetical protein VFN30_00935 [Chitinophagaceae bacterium]|nr:hypothetical protein [Chitinophagaceae bacterium]
METRIILATLCFTMSLASLARGIYLYKLEQEHSQSTSLFNASVMADTLTLMFFNGINSRNGIVLMWKPLLSAKTGDFCIERKDEDGNYVPIAHIRFNSAQTIYRFMDNNPQKSTSYRICQNDAIGRNFYSKPVLTSNC